MLYYCMGGGLGHLSRFLAVCNTFNISPTLLTASPYAENVDVIPKSVNKIVAHQEVLRNKETYKAWIHNIIQDFEPKCFYVDTFPGGILGELCDIPILQDTKKIIISRILKIETYKNRLEGKLPFFDKAYIVEKITNEQKLWLAAISNEVSEITLQYPSVLNPPHFSDNTWLIIHSGDSEELEQLCNTAMESAEIEEVKPQIVLIHIGEKPNFLPPNIKHLSRYINSFNINNVSRIFSAAGFNIINQITDLTKHRIIPMERALDDQHLRLKFKKNINL